jgi:hypothetical protein
MKAVPLQGNLASNLVPTLFLLSPKPVLSLTLVYANSSFFSGKGSVSSFAELAVRNTIALKKILDEGEDGGVRAVGKVMDLYQSCLDTKSLNSLGADPLLQLINATGQSGGWGEGLEWGVNFKGTPS